jgi:ABC-type Na+ efflux pump permease subunit
MMDIATIVIKEFWELRHSLRHFYWMFIWLALLAFIAFGDTNRSILPSTVILALFPSMIAFAGSGQIAFDSILSEKKSKTLEVLLSTKIPTVAIVIGKIIPPMIIGYLFSLISVIFLASLPLAGVSPIITSDTIWLIFVYPLLISYLASCISIVTTIIVPDEKVAPMIGTLLIITPLIILGRLDVFSLSAIAIITFIVGTILFSGLMTWLASFILGKTPMFTKM